MGRILFLALLSILLSLEAKNSICLNMIVKNESRVIRRCLDSVKPYIDYWVIVDTGSSDATKELIRYHLRDVPGELYERPWRNFGENRSEAFQLARHKGDYILFMDADDILVVGKDFTFQDLSFDLYNMWRGSEGFTYQKPQLVKGDLPWKWIGVTHEYLGIDIPYTSDLLNSDQINYVTCDGGHRSIGARKFFEDIQMLEEGLKKEPQNERYAFYLAESYRNAGQKGKALEWFQNRVSRGGWDEEVFWSLLQIGHILKDIGIASNLVKQAYLNAHEYRPHRAEPIYFLANLCNQEQDYDAAYQFLHKRDQIKIPQEKDALFNMDWIEEYGLLFEQSIAAFYVGKYDESIEACDRILDHPHVPDSWKEITKRNREFPLKHVKESKK